MEDLAVSLIETLKNERANRVVADRNLPAATAVGDAMKETRREVLAATEENLSWFRRDARLEARRQEFEKDIRPYLDKVTSAKADRTGLDDPCLEKRGALEAAQGDAYGALALWMAEAAGSRKDPAKAKANEEKARRFNDIAIACDLRALSCKGREAVEQAGVEPEQVEVLIDRAGGSDMLAQANEERAIMRGEIEVEELPAIAKSPKPVIEDAVLVDDGDNDLPALEGPDVEPEDPRLSRVRELAERRAARRAIPNRSREEGMDLDN